jgi:hypothetical protein
LLAAAALATSKRLKGKSYREAAAALENNRERKKTEKVKEKQASKPTPSGLIMEVVIPRHSSVKSDRSSPASSQAADEGEPEETGTHKRKRRAPVNKRVIDISDDGEGSASEVTSKAASSMKSSRTSASSSKKRRIMKRGSPSSDYNGSSSEDEDSDVEMISDFDDEEIPVKKSSKAKGKARAIPKPKAKALVQNSKDSEVSEDTGNDDDAMEVDDEPVNKAGKKKTTKKRKAADDEGRPQKKTKRADSDPWKLGSRAVQNEWTYMQAPPFEMFHFARVVVDEYTYLDGKIHSLVTNLTAERQWVLSGTPPIHDFAALKTIAAFLNIHLGVDDDGEGQSTEVKKRRREQTGICFITSCFIHVSHLFLLAVERFHSFREVHSLQWHAHRHTVGQRFLDQFVRQVRSPLSCCGSFLTFNG